MESGTSKKLNRQRHLAHQLLSMLDEDPAEALPVLYVAIEMLRVPMAEDAVVVPLVRAVTGV